MRTLCTLAAMVTLLACEPKPATTTPSSPPPDGTVTPPPTDPPPAAAECKPTGCSATVCSDQEVMTTCEFKPEYACYKTAECKRQDDGQCGWTKSAELDACLANPPPAQ